MTHEHQAKVREVRLVRGGGEITLERCECGALRLCAVNKHGARDDSAWEVEDDEDEMPLIWDGPDNDNDGEE